MIFNFVWGLLVIPLVSIVCGGYVGWFVSLGSGIGATIGVSLVAIALYGQMANHLLR